MADTEVVNIVARETSEALDHLWREGHLEVRSYEVLSEALALWHLRELRAHTEQGGADDGE